MHNYFFLSDAHDSCFEVLNVLLRNKKYGDKINAFFPQFWKYIQNLTKQDGLENYWYFTPNRPISDSVKVDKILIGKISSMVLSNAYVDPNITKEQQNSPLIYFCEIECLDAVKFLIQYKADVNHIGENGKTAVHHIMNINGNKIRICIRKVQN